MPLWAGSIGDRMIARQTASFVLIGLAVNAALYAAYLLLTHTLLGSFAAMTVTYCSGVVMGFLLNRGSLSALRAERPPPSSDTSALICLATWSTSQAYGCWPIAVEFPMRLCKVDDIGYLCPAVLPSETLGL